MNYTNKYPLKRITDVSVEYEITWTHMTVWNMK